MCVSLSAFKYFKDHKPSRIRLNYGKVDDKKVGTPLYNPALFPIPNDLELPGYRSVLRIRFEKRLLYRFDFLVLDVHGLTGFGLNFLKNKN